MGVQVVFGFEVAEDEVVGEEVGFALRIYFV